MKFINAYEKLNLKCQLILMFLFSLIIQHTAILNMPDIAPKWDCIENAKIKTTNRVRRTKLYIKAINRA